MPASSLRFRLLIPLALVIATLATGRAPIRPGEPIPIVDQHGDPLPSGAIARLGSVRLRHGAGLWDMAFSPDGETLATASGTSVHLWDTRTGKELRRLTDSDQELCCVAYSPDGKTIVGGGYEFVAVWGSGTGKTLLRLPVPDNRIHALAFSADSALLAVGGLRGALELWEVPTGRLQLSPIVTEGAQRQIQCRGHFTGRQAPGRE